MLPMPSVARRCLARRRDLGMTTAEYAVGTVGAVGLAGLLIKLLTSPEARKLIWAVIEKALGAFV